jgi:hypothetical protein
VSNEKRTILRYVRHWEGTQGLTPERLANGVTLWLAPNGTLVAVEIELGET